MKENALIRKHMDEFIAFRSHRGYRASANQDALSAFARHLSAQGIHELSIIDPNFMSHYASLLLESRAPGTVNRHMGTLRSFFQYLERMDLSHSNPLEEWKRFKELYFCPYVFSDAEIDRILKSLAEDAGSTKSLRQFSQRLSYHCMITILARCGLRLSEVCRLRLKDVCFREKTLSIEKTKFRKDRRIPVSNHVIHEIKNYLKIRAHFEAASQSEYVFLRQWGSNRHLGNHELGKPFLAKVRELGIWRPVKIEGNTVFGSPTPHSLRHAFAVRTIRRWQALGLSIDQIADTLTTYMGHTHFSSTQAYLKILAHKPGLLIFQKGYREQ